MPDNPQDPNAKRQHREEITSNPLDDLNNLERSCRFLFSQQFSTIHCYSGFESNLTVDFIIPRYTNKGRQLNALCLNEIFFAPSRFVYQRRSLYITS